MDNRELAFGGAEEVVGILGGEALHQRLRVGEADVLHRRARQAAEHVKRLLSCDEHAREIIERSLRVGAADRLMERGDEVIVTLAVLVVDGDAAVQQGRHPRRIEWLVELDVVQRLDLIKEEAAVAVGAGNQSVARIPGQRDWPADLFLRPLDEGVERVFVEASQDQHLAARQERGIQLEAGVLGRRPDKGNGAVLDEGKEAILLRAIEAVDLVHEQ